MLGQINALESLQLVGVNKKQKIAIENKDQEGAHRD